MFFWSSFNFLHDPTDVGNLISGSSASLKPSLYMLKVSVHVLLKASLKDFEHNLASMWDEHAIVLISHASKVILQILQASLQHYVNWELPDVQAGFQRGRGTRVQIANIPWIMEKARELQKNIYFFFIDYAKAFNCVHHNKLCTILKVIGIPLPYLSPEKLVCKSRSCS